MAKTLHGAHLALALWAACGGLAFADTVTHNTSAQFAAGTFSDTEDRGSGASPAIGILYNVDLGNGSNGSYTGNAPAVNGQYTDVTLTGTAPASGGLLKFKATGTVTINAIDVSGRGCSGGAGQGNNHGYDGSYSSGEGACVGGGNGGGRGNNGGGGGAGDNWGSGGGGGYGTSGETGPANQGGYGGSTYGDAAISTLYYGSGGGAGSYNNSCGSGGAGGGAVQIIAKKIIVNGYVYANGANGQTWDISGGGGSGGSVKLVAPDLTIGSNLVRALGGSGGGGGNRGGNGGYGRIRLEYGAVSGSTSQGSVSTATLPFKTTGTYRSAAIFTDRCSAYETLSWSVANASSIAFRLRSSADGINWGAWSSDFTSSPASLGSVPANQYVQYEVTLGGTTGSSPTLSSVSIQYNTNNPPSTPANPSPVDGGYVSDSTPLLSWDASTDADAGDTVTYYVTIADNVGLSSPIVDNASTGTTTSYQAGSLADNTYYWRVLAWDTKNYNVSPQIWSFVVDTQNPSPISIDGFHWNIRNSQNLTRVYGSGENSTVLTFFDGGDQSIAGSSTWDGSGNFTFTPTVPLVDGDTVYVRSRDAAQNTVYSDVVTVAFDAARNVSRDTTTYHGSGPGTSLRLDWTASYQFRIAANGGSPVTVTAWLRKSSGYDGAAPQISLSGMGIVGVSDAMTVGANTWEQLSVTGTPGAAGVLTLTVQTTGTADTATVWLDDIAVSQ